MDADKYSAEESRKRFEAALKGARIAGPKPNESLTPKRVRKQTEKKKRQNQNRKRPAAGTGAVM
jgi:hypothetical protein